MLHGSSLLLDLDGIIVESVQRTVEGSRIVQIATAPEWVGMCPQCGQKSTRSKGWVTTRPRDVQLGPDRPLLVWRKRKWLCTDTSCERKVFTESTPGVPPRAKALLAETVLDGDRSVAAVAGDYGCAWHTVHEHLVVVADAALAGEPEAVMVLGIDETRRGKTKWETDPDTGKRSWVDRWDTGLVDLTGDQGLLAQVNGRTSAVLVDWFDARDEAWKAQITDVAIDMSSVYAKAVREALPHADLWWTGFTWSRRRTRWSMPSGAGLLRRSGVGVAVRVMPSGSIDVGCCGPPNGSPSNTDRSCSRS
ncbi:zinc-finger of transposase IS204/IS1001/IS1096/IS1165 [Rhodococcus rhodochrous J3]|uniref:Transposase n=2 Tax=Rhodococcus rhodochrous TaxID=1829 RepID=A0A562E2L4_RHORH|nr:transposase [Rhodococcus rhodochrous J45]TWH44451.1 transposase [Rhodococcus rhodochrous J38]SMG58031.1 zinc-finger of transposase IS204/IS1001/IS1096/IS1165 [Rhodococcus rhodochrous J3]